MNMSKYIKVKLYLKSSKQPYEFLMLDLKQGKIEELLLSVGSKLITNYNDQLIFRSDDFLKIEVIDKNK